MTPAIDLIRSTLAVFGKESRDALRDRRSITAALIYSFFGPLVVGLALGSVAKNSEEDALQLAVAGAEHAPALIAFLEARGVEFEPVAGAAADAVEQDPSTVVMIVPSDYPERFRDSRPAPVDLFFDSADDDGRQAASRARELVEGYGRATAEARLFAHGVSPSISRPVEMHTRDLATTAGRAGRVLGILPIYLLMAAFIGGMNVAIDVTAGERERSSLESLLVHPVPRLALAAGKWLAATALNVVAVMLTLAVSMLVLEAPQLEALEVPLGISMSEAALLLVLLLPLAFFAPAVQMLLALFAKSYKEGQTYLSLLLMVPILPGMLIVFKSFEVESWMESLPLLGHQMLMADVLSGKAAGFSSLLVLGAVTLALGLGVVAVTGRLLHHERVVLGH